MPINLKDHIGDLDKTLKGLSPSVLEKLAQNQRFADLNGELQSAIQQELMMLVRNKLNMDSNIVNNINSQMELIDEAKRGVEADKDASLNEMNDYMRNYSHLTFDEYKRMKNGEPIEKKKR